MSPLVIRTVELKVIKAKEKTHIISLRRFNIIEPKPERCGLGGCVASISHLFHGPLSFLHILSQIIDYKTYM